MIFQTFDDKKDCIAVYAKNKLYLKKLPNNLTKTWAYSESLCDKKVEYAKYYCEGKTLDEVCPPYLRKEWEAVNQKLKAFHRATNEAKLNLNDHCFFDLMPPHVLIKYGEIKNKICNYVFQTCSKPANYDYVVGVARVLTEIKNTKLNIDMTPLKKRRHEFKVRQFIRKMKRTSPYIIYDMRGTKTGRLAAREFPILTMDKSYRKIIKPNNKWFLELDYNAAELRVLLSLSEREQPKEDIHDWNLKNIYGNTGSRESAKKRIFAWLYNPSSKDVATSNVYNRTDVLKRYWDGTHVKTHFGRIIEADKHHALNYIVQSTAADLFLRQMIKVGDFLRDKKSKIAFCLHDSLVIDLHEEDEHFINEIKGIFANTELGTFKVNSHGGRNFGEMKRINVN